MTDSVCNNHCSVGLGSGQTGTSVCLLLLLLEKKKEKAQIKVIDPFPYCSLNMEYSPLHR